MLVINVTAAGGVSAAPQPNPSPPVVPPVSWLHNELRVALVGREVDLSYTYDHLGEESDVLQQLANGTHPFCEVMRGTHTHTHTHTHTLAPLL